LTGSNVDTNTYKEFNSFNSRCAIVQRRLQNISCVTLNVPLRQIDHTTGNDFTYFPAQSCISLLQMSGVLFGDSSNFEQSKSIALEKKVELLS